MSARVSLIVTQGSLRGQRFDFEDRTTCIIGRARGCQPRLPDDDDHQAISRHHCLLDINPPDIRIRDFGSLNGTQVNEVNIGQRRPHQSPAEASRDRFRELILKDGDEISLSRTVFEVHITVPPRCEDCGMELGGEPIRPRDLEKGRLFCSVCRGRRQEESTAPQDRSVRRTCACCRKELPIEAGFTRPGDLVCQTCQDKPFEVARHLLDLAGSPGTRILFLRDFTIVREIGSGGMGAVYLARRISTGEEVALKLMLPRVATDPQASERFLREAENTLALDHPNVVRVYEGDFAAGTFFFTMEYCDGGSLAGLLRESGGKLSIGDACALALQALDGLDYAHNAPLPHVRRSDGTTGPGQGLVHRDLKPGNIFLVGSGRNHTVKIGDYGLAKAFDLAGLSGQTCTGDKAGSPRYMSRRQVINFKYAKPEVDVWALAATLYKMLTGCVPRDFPPDKDIWHVVLNTDPVPIRFRNPRIPSRLAEVIDRALIDRFEEPLCFPSAAGFKQALQDVM